MLVSPHTTVTLHFKGSQNPTALECEQVLFITYEDLLPACLFLQPFCGLCLLLGPYVFQLKSYPSLLDF